MIQNNALSKEPKVNLRLARMGGILSLLVLACMYSLSITAYASTVASSELVAKIDQAIQDAQGKLGHELLADGMKKNISLPATKQTMKKNPSPSISSNVEAVASKAEKAYRDRKNYLQAYELSQTALKLDPNNESARKVRDSIYRDLDEEIEELSPFGDDLVPPDGAIAYRVAVSDNLLTLEEAKDIGVKNNIELLSLRKRIQGGKGKLNEAIRALYPKITAEVSVSAGVINEAYTGESWKIDGSQPLYYGGELLFTIKQAESALESDRLEYEKARLEVIKNIGETYRSLVNTEYNYGFQTDLYEEISELKRVFDEAFKQRLVPEIEYYEVDSIANQTAFQMESALSTWQQAQIRFFEALSLRVDNQVPVDLNIDLEEKEIDMNAFLKMVTNNNLDIKIKQMATKSAYYSVKVFDAQRKPRVDLRGSFGLSGEAFTGLSGSRVIAENGDGRGINTAQTLSGPIGTPDLEKEHFIGINVSMPVFGANTASYSYQRRFFAPTVSTFQGSEDYKHTWSLGLLDKLDRETDEDIAKAEYLKAKAELQSEKMGQLVNARQSYFDYQGALLQLKTSESKLAYRERQIEILKHTTKMDESNLSDLLNEMVSLTEERFSRITAISDAKDALSNMNTLVGIEGYYDTNV